MVRWTVIAAVLGMSVLHNHALSLETQEREVDVASVILTAGAVREDLDGGALPQEQ